MTKAAELAKMGEVLTNSQIGGRRNIIINGAMQVAQRGTSSTSTGFQTCDRIQFLTNNTDNFAFTVSQSSTAPDGFSTSQKLDCTTAESSLAADELARFLYKVEGQDLQNFNYGSSASEEVTVSFYVRSNVTGVYTVEFRLNAAGTSTITKQYTISSANTWERKILKLPTNTATSVDNDNSNGIELSFCVAAGSNFTTGSLGTSWATTATSSRYAGQAANIMSSTDNEWYITGIQMELGSQATPFEHRSFGEELLLCQRYAIVYSKNGQPNMGQKAIGTGASTNSSGAYQAFIFPQVTMRAVPTLTVGGSVSDYEILKYETGFVDLNSSISLYSASGRSLFVLAISSATAEAERGRDVIMRLEGDNSSLLFDSEL